MGKISRNQKDYIKAYEELSKTGINVSARIMLAEMSYEEIKQLVEYKSNSNLKSEEYYTKIDRYYNRLLSTFFMIDSTSSIYDNYKLIFNQIYLDNTDDDTNDYNKETMEKLNKIYSFINNLENQDLSGTELLSLIRREINNEEDMSLKDDYFDVQFDELKKQCEDIKVADNDTKMLIIPTFLTNVGDMESHLFRRKLFKDDYRKSVTGLMNYLFIRAELPPIYIKPIELDEYYECVSRVNNIENTEIVNFYKEKICDSIEDVLITPMKNAIKYDIEEKIRKESGDLDNKIYTLKQNKYK